MKAISDQLSAITNELGFIYDRSASIEESNIFLHYEPTAAGYVIYTGFDDSSIIFEGATPAESVQVSVWCITRKKKIDQLTENTDIQLVIMHQLAADIVAKFKGLEDIKEYNLEPVYNRFDDLFIGYILTFTAVIQGDGCSD